MATDPAARVEDANSAQINHLLGKQSFTGARTEEATNAGAVAGVTATRVTSARDTHRIASSGSAEGNAGKAGSESRVIGSARSGIQTGPEQSVHAAAGNNGAGVTGGRRRKKKQISADSSSGSNKQLISNASSQPLNGSDSASRPLDVSDPRVWLPPPPDVPMPRATHNAAMLAYIGDGIYELYARRHFLSPPSAIATYCQRVTAVVCCEAQDALLRRLIASETLSKEERDVVRWGGNASTGARKAKGRAGSTVYANATALETLIGFLYLTDSSRLEQLMTQLGFVCDASDLLLPSHTKRL